MEILFKQKKVPSTPNRTDIVIWMKIQLFPRKKAQKQSENVENLFKYRGGKHAVYTTIIVFFANFNRQYQFRQLMYP